MNFECTYDEFKAAKELIHYKRRRDEIATGGSYSYNYGHVCGVYNAPEIKYTYGMRFNAVEDVLPKQIDPAKRFQEWYYASDSRLDCKYGELQDRSWYALETIHKAAIPVTIKFAKKVEPMIIEALARIRAK